MDLDEKIRKKLISLAGQYRLQKVVLFGSRAKGTNSLASDVDLAVWGINSARQFLDFKEAVEEEVPTLLMFDIVDIQSLFASDSLIEEIERDGIVLYEEV